MNQLAQPRSSYCPFAMIGQRYTLFRIHIRTRTNHVEICSRCSQIIFLFSIQNPSSFDMDINQYKITYAIAIKFRRIIVWSICIDEGIFNTFQTPQCIMSTNIFYTSFLSFHSTISVSIIHSIAFVFFPLDRRLKYEVGNALVCPEYLSRSKKCGKSPFGKNNIRYTA